MATAPSLSATRCIEMARRETVVLAEAIADQLGIDMTPEFVTQVDLIRYRLFLTGYSVRRLGMGPSRPPAGFVFPAASTHYTGQGQAN